MTPPSANQPRLPRWTREQIRSARQVSMAPLLRKEGLELIELAAGNFQLRAYPGLVIKDSYWRWPQRELSGNTIDFLVKVLGFSFNDAMRKITAT